jgi:hypothetical protein
MKNDLLLVEYKYSLLIVMLYHNKELNLIFQSDNFDEELHPRI